MDKINSSQILVKGIRLTAKKLNSLDSEILKRIKDTKVKQGDLLSLKSINQNDLRTVVQL